MMDSQNNKKYKSVITTAKELFWKYGIKRVTIEEICSEAKVSKMTFYKFFPNKIELAKTILGDLMDLSMNKFNEVASSNMAFSKKLEAVFLIKIEAANDLSQELINDIYSNTDFGLREHLEEMADSFRSNIVNFYKDAQADGFIRKEVNIDFIMAYSAQMPTLMKDEKLLAQYNKPMDFILEVMNMMFYGIVTSNE